HDCSLGEQEARSYFCRVQPATLDFESGRSEPITPRTIPGGVSREEYATHQRDVIMAMFGISHTKDTPVGDDFMRGVSGGERKRVTIAEAALSYAPLQCWDNSTRGLDTANAIEFCKTLRLQGDIYSTTSCVAIYQAPQAAYELFHKVIVLYDGRQIFFGQASEAKAYFEALGFESPSSQTIPDFLTSMTCPTERIVKAGFEHLVPRTADEFAQRWRYSPECKDLLKQIDQYIEDHPFDDTNMRNFAEARKCEKSSKQRERSPYTLSYWRQIQLCMWREFHRIKANPAVSIFTILVNLIQNIIIGSVFFNLKAETASFTERGALMFMMIVLSALSSVLEIMALYDKRSIVEKHSRYALYHPSAEAIASSIMDLPSKLVMCICSNIAVYFMAGLRRTPGAFFFYLLMAFTSMMCMSMFFRFFASMTKTVSQATAPVSIINMALSLYTGFTLPVPYILGWARWIYYINPIAYAFEAILVNELHNRDFPCSNFVPSGPGYENVDPLGRSCSTVGAVPGSSNVNGDDFLEQSYRFSWDKRWRDFGILLAFTVFFTILYLVGSELVTAERSKGEVLVFRRSQMHNNRLKRQQTDEEQTKPGKPSSEKSETSGEQLSQVEKQTAVFHWQNVCYDITANGEQKRLLDNVDGWIKPGSLTALMGVSGAGKTTLLNVLASRTTTGVITGGILVDGHQRDSSFQRKTGYVQQQDLHISTSTVREALEFSALLRQPSHYTRRQRLDYVDTVISLLGMEEYADAVVGIPGSGLNIEQRKRLTIGVELAARPKLLLFLDEPTSGLDSQTSWSICNLMEKLANNGQAILCTIHQPSAMLFQRFSRLLLLARGGKTVYFGAIGRDSNVLIDYFARNGGAPCPPGTNPAEYMLEVIGAAPGVKSDIDWPAVWRGTEEYREVHRELDRLRELADHAPNMVDPGGQPESDYEEFAVPFITQTHLVTIRVFQQMWRTPSYIYSKLLLCLGCALLLGFSFFNSPNTTQGLQNQMFGVFLFLFIYIQIIQQMMPMFVKQRTLYEARERQSKTYCWQSFILSNLLVELAWNTLMAILSFLVWFYPMGVWQNALYTDTLNSRSMLAFLVVWEGFLYATSLSYLFIAGMDSDQSAGGLSMLANMIGFLFCGILAGPDTLPRFWIFMYRTTPFTYLVNSFLTTALAEAPMHCAANELLSFAAPQNQTCAQYMALYMQNAGGYLVNPDTRGGSSENCHFCALDNTTQFLKSVNMTFDNRWRDLGILWAYIIFNTAGAIFFYWLVRVPKGKKMKSS
ncbi:uncharacterized protein N7479_011361, partial [Penicillium vulpinum]